MTATLQKVTLNIKNDKASYTTSNIRHDCTDDNLVKYAEAYNSLQKTEADKFIKRTQYLITL